MKSIYPRRLRPRGRQRVAAAAASFVLWFAAALAHAQPTTLGQGVSLAHVLEETLRVHPEIRIARAELAETSGLARAARAPLDWTVEANAGHEALERGLPPAERLVPEERTLAASDTRVSLGLEKRFGWGTRVVPTVALVRSAAHRAPVDARPPEAWPALNRAEVRIALTQPLLRGRGTDANWGPIEAAERTREAALQQARAVTQRRVLEAATAYWGLVVAGLEVELLEASVARYERILAETMELVEADQRPRGDLRQLEGNLAARRRATQRARSQQVQASHRLRLAMGREPEADVLLVPSDDFPLQVDRGQEPTAKRVEAAVASRPEMAVLEFQHRAAQRRAAAAAANAGPALDLTLHAGYAGYVSGDAPEDLARALGEGVAGFDAGVLLSLSLPVNNYAYGGDLDVARAALDALQEQHENMARTVRAEVIAAVDLVVFARHALAQARQAEAQFQQALQDERDKLRAGLSTVIDVVLTEELTTQAQFDRVQSEYELALSVLELRRAGGQLPEAPAQAVAGARALLGEGRAL